MKMKGKTRIFAAIFFGIAIGIILKIFFIDIINIQGASMEPTFHEGQFAVVNRIRYGLNKPFADTLMTQWSTPQKGDIVVYLIDNALVIKRCMATEGDLLEFSYNSGYTLEIGNRSFPLTEAQYHKMKDFTSVPGGTIMTIGDNYEVSIDSRTYGFVPVKNILGKVICRPTDF